MMFPEVANNLRKNRYDRSLIVSKWFNSLSIYSAVLLLLSLLTNIWFTVHNDLYTIYERIIFSVSCLSLLGFYLHLILRAFYTPSKTHASIVVILMGVTTGVLQTIILFSSISENIIDLELQQHMITKQSFKAFRLFQKTGLGINLIVSNTYLFRVFLSAATFSFLLILCPAYTFLLFHHSGRRKAFLEYLNSRQTVYEQ